MNYEDLSEAFDMGRPEGPSDARMVERRRTGGVQGGSDICAVALATHRPCQGYLGLHGEPGSLWPLGRRSLGIAELGREEERRGNLIPRSGLLGGSTGRSGLWVTASGAGFQGLRGKPVLGGSRSGLACLGRMPPFCRTPWRCR